jgi:hypothetical protein
VVTPIREYLYLKLKVPSPLLVMLSTTVRLFG